MAAPFSVAVAATPQDFAAIAELFREYSKSIDLDLTFQSFDAEVAGLPGKYGPPRGVLLLARGSDGGPLGCVAMRPLPWTEEEQRRGGPAGSRCEIKRLYVRAAARGMGLGEALVRRAIAEATSRGHTEVVMDTLTSMDTAQRLYAKLGFVQTDAYYETPAHDRTIFYRLELEGVS